MAVWIAGGGQRTVCGMDWALFESGERIMARLVVESQRVDVS